MNLRDALGLCYFQRANIKTTRPDGGDVEIGFNDDVDYRGLTFHIQTEDHGEGDPRVSTQLFFHGRILDSKTVAYGHLLEGLAGEEERRAKIRKVMVAAHRNFYKRLMAGEYDETAGLNDEGAPQPAVADPEEEARRFEPSQSRVPDSAVKVMEEDGKVTFTFDDGNVMDLRALSRELNKIDVMPPDAEGGANNPFGDLGFDESEDEGTPAPQLIQEVAAAPVKHVPDFSPTGRRAFQGLLEPKPRVDVVELVLGFLKSHS